MGWERKKLSDLGEITSSKRIFKSEYVSDGIPFYRTKEIKNLASGDEIVTELFISKERFEEIEKKYGSPKEGDILLTAIGTIGEIYVVQDDGEFYFKDGNVLWLKKFDSVDKYFLKYALMAFVDEIKLLSRGTAYNALPINKLKNHEVILPLIPEQKRIVAILDKAFAQIEQARAKTEQNLKNARELFESYLQQVFSQRGEGWEESTLNLISENLDSKRIPITKKDRVEGQYPYYGASGVVDYVNNYLFDEELLLVSEDGANLLARTYPIAFAAMGKFWVNNHAHVLRFENSSMQKFIEYYLNSISLVSYISGMAQPKLNQKALNSISVPKVSKLIADEVVQLLTALEKEIISIEGVYKLKLNALEELKKSILQKAFTGELTAKDAA